MRSLFTILALVAVSVSTAPSILNGQDQSTSNTFERRRATSFGKVNTEPPSTALISSVTPANVGQLDGEFAERPTGIVARASTTPTPKAKKVFAHYLLGTVTQAHAQKDVDDAIAMGLDGFAINIGDPSASFITTSLSNLIGYAAFRGFNFFFSLDVYASGDSCYHGNPGACGGPDAYHTLLANNLGNAAWMKGPNGKPIISTYSSGGATNTAWAAWRQSLAQNMYFIPDFDETQGYYTSDPGWWGYWGNIVDGLFSWEAAWPARAGFGGQFAGDISPDLPVLAGATSHGKGYMMPLSTLQYKNAYGANVYRAGDLNLPVRMTKILGMTESPDYIQVISWNDGPEGHYIGNLWYEQNNDTVPHRYANSVDWDHSGWQPLISSFIQAWKNGKPASQMAPPTGQPAIGALWYKTILQSSTCPASQNALLASYSLPPDAFNTGTDQLNYAIVIEPGGTGYTAQAYSNGVALAAVNLVPGLNYGSFTGVRAGYQQLFLYKNSAVVLSAITGRCVSAGCPDCIYNMNYQVVALVKDIGTVGTCPYAVCQKKVFAHYLVGNVYPVHAQTDIDNAVSMGLDGFALNVADPTQAYVTNTFNSIFDYTAQKYPNFKLFISMDLYAEGQVYNQVLIDKYHTLLANFKGHPAYFQGPNGYSFVSTFSSGGLQNTDWTAWRKSFAEQVYLVPDLDDTAGYKTSDPGWWAYWGGIIQGTFSWETTWPLPGQPVAALTAPVDQVIIQGTYQHIKSYMISLSPLQYKNAYNTNYFRGGNQNLPQRMVAILELDPSPDYVEYVTWNDGPESHYMGNLWLEQNNDTQPGLYSDPSQSHIGWQPLVTSFIAAFKAGLKGKDMAPPSGKFAIGAMWYNSILSTSTCPTENLGGYFAKPNGFSTVADQLNFAVVVKAGATGALMRAISNGQQLTRTIPLNPGLNFGYFPGISAGFQKMELVASDGSVQAVAAGGRCISSGCPDCIYNLNPVVVGFGADTGAVGPCSQRNCATVVESVGGGAGATVYIDSTVFFTPTPTVYCQVPCTLVLPPSKVSGSTVITFSPVSTSLVVGGVTVTSVSPTPITTTVIEFSNMPIPAGATSFAFGVTSSLKPNPVTVIAGGATSVITLPPQTTPYSGPEVVTVSNVPYTVFGGIIVVSGSTLTIPPATATTTEIYQISGQFVTLPTYKTASTTYYSLPTTVYMSNGVTQTFSEAQFTDLATITAPTTRATTIYPPGTVGPSTTSSGPPIPVIFSVQSGGFYWSPLPRPNLNPPFPFPTLPGLPPIPGPPCFKLFNIFSLFCPPDKTKPTSIFISGPGGPTCKSGCGTVCAANCDSNPTSSAKPSSSTCTTSSVTDYFVACLGGSCTTTSSATVRGCSITATAVTQTCSPAGTYIPWWANTNDFIPTLGINAGTVVATGTWTTPPFYLPSAGTTTSAPATATPSTVITCSTTTGVDRLAPNEATAIYSSFCSFASGKPVPPSVQNTYRSSNNIVINFSIANLGAITNAGCANFHISQTQCSQVYDMIVSTCKVADSGFNHLPAFYGGVGSIGCFQFVY